MWDDNWFDENDTAYIGRTAVYYDGDLDEDDLIEFLDEHHVNA